jgi:hypothetical protein
VYDFGYLGRDYREVDEERTDRETAIRNLKEANTTTLSALSASTRQKGGST